MTQEERLTFLLDYLLRERQEKFDIPADPQGRRQLLRALMNVRMPAPVSDEFLGVQDAYLQEEIRRKGITDLQELEPVEPGIYLWQGDITTLRCDAIVNAANSQMLGCFVPCHGCIDNAIHSFAGVQLRLACQQLMQRQGHEEGTGEAKSPPPSTFPAAMCCTRWGRSSPAGAPGGTASCWQAATAPVWSWPNAAAAGVWPSAAFPPESFIFQTGWRRRLPSRRCGPTDKNRQPPWR